MYFSIPYGTLFLSITFVVQSAFATGRHCSEIATIRGIEDNNIVPNILYFEEADQQTAEISCNGETSGVVELIANDVSLGVIENGSRRAICRLGRWYSLSKYGRITVVKDVSCLVHL